MEIGRRFADERALLVETLHALGACALSPGRSGNASIRVPGGMLISATGVSAADAQPHTLVFIDDNGHAPPDQWRPSSEWQLHHAIYAARDDAGAVVHCHSRYATALACQRRAIPAYHYMIAAAGGDDIRCAAYATFGTAALAAAVSTALEGRRACLLANHGQVALGSTPEAALQLAQDVEELAAGYYLTLAVGGPVVLGDAEMRAVATQFRDYGQQPEQP